VAKEKKWSKKKKNKKNKKNKNKNKKKGGGKGRVTIEQPMNPKNTCFVEDETLEALFHQSFFC
jgi:hypothetical protein